MCQEILKKLLKVNKFYITFEKLPIDVITCLLKNEFTILFPDDEKTYNELIKEFISYES